MANFKTGGYTFSPYGETIVFKNRWYGKSTTFTINKVDDTLDMVYQRSNKHIGDKEF